MATDPLKYTGPGRLTVLKPGISGEDLREMRGQEPGRSRCDVRFSGKSKYWSQRAAAEAEAQKLRKKLRPGPKLADKCARGHPFTPENTRLRAGKWQVCRTCENQRHRERRARLGAKEGRGGNQRHPTQCPHGHEFTPENTLTTKKGYRVCRTCKRESDKERRDRIRDDNGLRSVIEREERRSSSEWRARLAYETRAAKRTWPSPKQWMARKGKDFDILENGCWQWLGALTSGRPNQQGYGLVFVSGKVMRAHRVSYQVLKGKIPEGLVIDHICENRACVNPDHMELVTPGINVLRGRSPSAMNLGRTSCVNGHPYSDGSFWVNKRTGWRKCKLCARESERRRKKKLLAAM